MNNLLNVRDYQLAAQDKLPKATFEYLTSGSDDEQTLKSNVTCFAHWYLRPKILRNVRNLDAATILFGKKIRMPLFASPAGVHGLFHPEGECYTACVCREFGIPFGVSQHSTRTIEEVGNCGGNLWYQAYILKDRSRTETLIRRSIATKAYSAIVLTVDSVRFGVRHADARNGFNALPPPHRLVNYDVFQDHTYNAKEHAAWDQNSELMFETNLNFRDLQWIKHLAAGLPVIVKGVMTAEDAVSCEEAGADAIVVSNHGGRQLDGCLATIDALPSIVSAVRIPVLLDGGIRKGTDILKALALGATAVGIGRPLFYGLAVDDLKGLLHILLREFETAMALTGTQSVRDVDRSLIQQTPLPLSRM